jgi:sarcosine oxidase subunit gamma
MSIEISFLTPGVMIETATAKVSVLPAQGRLSLRARVGTVAPLGIAFGLALPERIGRRATACAVEAIRLGPDEWTILAPEEDVARLTAACAALAAHPHSLVDISGREVTLLVEGPKAAELLTLGCPRDIATILPGEGRRTLFDSATVVLWRDAADRFRLDVWNSFASHVTHLLETGCRELAAELA